MKIREVFAGANGQPAAQFVELQMHASGQNVVGGKQIVVYDSAGAVIDTFTFPTNVANSANQSSILIATAAATTFFGVTPDLTITPVIPAAGGKVCFIRPAPLLVVDCVSWGSYSGSNVGTGAPFNPAGGLVSGWSALRDISGGTSPTLLQAADDTGDSAADFDLAIPTPRNNAGATTTTAGQADVAAGTLGFLAAAGPVTNNVTLPAAGGGFYTLRDTGAPVTPGAGCQTVSVNEVRCRLRGDHAQQPRRGAGERHHAGGDVDSHDACRGCGQRLADGRQRRRHARRRGWKRHPERAQWDRRPARRTQHGHAERRRPAPTRSTGEPMPTRRDTPSGPRRSP